MLDADVNVGIGSKNNNRFLFICSTQLFIIQLFIIFVWFFFHQSKKSFSAPFHTLFCFSKCIYRIWRNMQTI